MYETIFSSFNLGGVTLKNRIIFAPTSFALPQAEYKEKLRAIACGGCAMIIIGDVPIDAHGFNSLHSKSGFAFYQSICEIVHSYNCKICAQLHQSDSNMKAMIKYIPSLISRRIPKSELHNLLNQEVLPYITGLSEQKVKSITDSFGTAAILAQKAGFDLVEVHGDRMCGSFSSDLFNKRTDRYGGNPKQRAQFAVEAVASVHRAVPNMPIDFKLAVRQENPHYGNGGILLEELPVFLPLLEQAGVTSFHVTLANHSLLSDTIPPSNHPYFKGEGCFLKYCDAVKALSKLPVCGVGGLTSPDFIESQLLTGRIDCAAMSRQLIADPNWPQKVQNGNLEKIDHCIRCNKQCLDGIQNHRGVHCIYERNR